MGSFFRMPLDRSGHLDKAMKLLSASAWEQAEQAFAVGLQAFPDDPDLLANRSNLFLLRQRYSEALDDIDAALQRAGASSSASWAMHGQRGRILVLLGRHSEAEQALDLALHSPPDHAPAGLLAVFHHHRARCRSQRGDTAGAAEDATRACALDPDEARYHLPIESAAATPPTTSPPAP